MVHRKHISLDAKVIIARGRIDIVTITALTVLQIHAMRWCMNYVDVQADKCQNKLKRRVVPEDFRYRFACVMSTGERGQTQMRVSGARLAAD